MEKIIGVTLTAVLLFCGCLKNNNPASPQHSSAKSVVAVSISLNYSEGTMGLYSITDSAAYKNLLSIWTDNDIRTYNGSIYVLERSGRDNIFRIAGSVIADSTVVYDRNIGSSVNIQDIAFISPIKAYITQYANPQVVIFNPSTGEKANKTVDLSAYVAYFGTDSATSTPYASSPV